MRKGGVALHKQNLKKGGKKVNRREKREMGRKSGKLAKLSLIF